MRIKIILCFLFLLALAFPAAKIAIAGGYPCGDSFCSASEEACLFNTPDNDSCNVQGTSDGGDQCTWCGHSCANNAGECPIAITFEECMFTGTGDYECFCSGDGKNFFKIECTQERFDFCVNDALGEVKRLLVVGDTNGNEYTLDLECSNVAYCGNDMTDGTETCDGTDLALHDCVSEGFDSGTLACEADCQSFDTTGCFD